MTRTRVLKRTHNFLALCAFSLPYSFYFCVFSSPLRRVCFLSFLSFFLTYFPSCFYFLKINVYTCTVCKQLSEGARPLYEMEALALHEAIPGHHTQTMLAAENQGLPPFRRFMDDRRYSEAPGEEWGPYAATAHNTHTHTHVCAFFFRLSRGLRVVWRGPNPSVVTSSVPFQAGTRSMARSSRGGGCTARASAPSSGSTLTRTRWLGASPQRSFAPAASVHGKRGGAGCLSAETSFAPAFPAPRLPAKACLRKPASLAIPRVLK